MPGPYLQRVLVTYTGNFAFSPDPVEMDGFGDIVFQVDPTGQAFTFQSIGFQAQGNTNPNGIDDFTYALSSDKQSLYVHDNDVDPGTYAYMLIIQTSNGSTQADPQIINKV